MALNLELWTRQRRFERRAAAPRSGNFRVEDWAVG
jgi:hypothetical protein